MKEDSAVVFETDRRIHIALAAGDLERSVAFYRMLFGVGPTKRRPRYARFEVGDPPLNLALNEVGGPTGPENPASHFGIQVRSTDAVRRIGERLSRAGLDVVVEDAVSCCYALQKKVWAVDPDGNRWEVFVVVKDDGASHAPAAAGREPSCCSAEAEPDREPLGISCCVTEAAAPQRISGRPEKEAVPGCCARGAPAR